MKKTLLKIFFITASILLSNILNATTVVIVHTSNPDSSITKKLAKKIFMKKTTTTGSIEIIPVDQDEGSDIRNDFFIKAAKKNPDRMKKYWSKMIFSGRSRPPEIKIGDEAVIEWVRQNKDAIGYINSKSADKTVKVILKLP